MRVYGGPRHGRCFEVGTVEVVNHPVFVCSLEKMFGRVMTERFRNGRFCQGINSGAERVPSGRFSAAMNVLSYGLKLLHAVVLHGMKRVVWKES
jgi:hypothetical protein